MIVEPTIYTTSIMTAIISLLAMSSALSVNDCSQGTSRFILHNVSISPGKVKPGEPVSVNLRYTVPERVVFNGVVRYTVTYNFIPFSPVTMPLCDVIECPIIPGIYTNKTMSHWPWGIRETIYTEIKWLDEDGSLLLCMATQNKF
jgi:hypothetical protein